MASSLSANATEFVPSFSVKVVTKPKKTKEQRGPRKRRRQKKNDGDIDQAQDDENLSFDSKEFAPLFASSTHSEASSVSNYSLSADLIVDGTGKESKPSIQPLNDNHNNSSHEMVKAASRLVTSSSISRKQQIQSPNMGGKPRKRSQPQMQPKNRQDWSNWFDTIVQRFDGPDSPGNQSPHPYLRPHTPLNSLHVGYAGKVSPKDYVTGLQILEGAFMKLNHGRSRKNEDSKISDLSSASVSKVGYRGVISAKNTKSGDYEEDEEEDSVMAVTRHLQQEALFASDEYDDIVAEQIERKRWGAWAVHAAEIERQRRIGVNAEMDAEQERERRARYVPLLNLCIILQLSIASS
jgi:hypothetical protein